MDKCQEACAVFGLHAPGEDVSRLTYFGLFALQHRGQESAGIAVSDGKKIKVHADMGLVQQVFDEERLGQLRGDLAIGHTRYSTSGASQLRNVQPVVVSSKAGTIALSHNGNLVNVLDLYHEVTAAGWPVEAGSDSAVMAAMIAQRWEQLGDLESAIVECCKRWSGAYSLAILTEDSLLALRDPHGIRPLCLGTLNGHGYVVASETCALNVVGAQFLREVEPGELVVIDERGLRSSQVVPPQRPAMCIFEFIYFARPDSYIYGKLIHETRRQMGGQLAHDQPVEADVVIPVPDTGWPVAIGYAEASGIPFREGLIKNRYIARTFIQPDQRQRELGVKLKLSPLSEALAGKRVVLVDDSIVRGTTKRGIVELVRDAGATEVHVRISAPPYCYPCFYGVDTSDRKELIAARLGSVDEIRRAIGADTLGYQSVEGLMQAIGLPREKFCLACFDGNYPIPVPDELKARKFALETATSVREETGADSRVKPE